MNGIDLTWEIMEEQTIIIKVCQHMNDIFMRSNNRNEQGKNAIDILAGTEQAYGPEFVPDLQQTSPQQRKILPIHPVLTPFNKNNDNDNHNIPPNTTTPPTAKTQKYMQMQMQLNQQHQQQQPFY